MITTSSIYDVGAPLGCVVSNPLKNRFPQALKEHLHLFFSSPFAQCDVRDGVWMRNLDKDKLELFVWSAAQALVGVGINPGLVLKLDDLVSISAFREIVDWYADRREWAFYVALSLIRVAQFCGTVSDDRIFEMRRIASHLAPVTADN
ncbi:hypothetical protein F4695_004566 [Rhizobium soli]|uniref:Uncharacterized protein n=1 Tax=Rhizobium soli TaxID=424798 RepID=A0A7X0JP24_9HYPH|nr:hypothetical protein [Rhizobium soli]MBB6511168.1 hypothetical protein [Rhizobium soli]